MLRLLGFEVLVVGVGLSTRDGRVVVLVMCDIGREVECKVSVARGMAVDGAMKFPSYDRGSDVSEWPLRIEILNGKEVGGLLWKTDWWAEGEEGVDMEGVPVREDVFDCEEPLAVD